MDVFTKLKGETLKTLNELQKWTKDSGAELAAVFGKLKKTGKNTTDGIVQWMKDVKLIISKEAEDKIRAALDKSSNKKDIQFTEFREVVTNHIDERKKELEGVGAAVKEEGGKLAAALQAGTSTLQGALGIKEDAAKEK